MQLFVLLIMTHIAVGEAKCCRRKPECKERSTSIIFPLTHSPCRLQQSKVETQIYPLDYSEFQINYCMKNSLPKKCSFLTIKSGEHSTNEILSLNLFLQWLPEYRYSKYEPFKTVPTNFFFQSLSLSSLPVKLKLQLFWNPIRKKHLKRLFDP